MNYVLSYRDKAWIRENCAPKEQKVPDRTFLYIMVFCAMIGGCGAETRCKRIEQRLDAIHPEMSWRIK